MKIQAGTTAVITGGGSGIGRGIARVFAEAGINLVVSDIDLAAANETCDLLSGFPVETVAVQVDVSDYDSVDRLARTAFDSFPEVNLLCNNAGVCLFSDLAQTTSDDWRWLVDVNILGVAHCLSAFLPGLLEQSTAGIESRIVNTSSSAGLVGFAGCGAYTATKFAVNGMSESLRQELEGTRVGVSVLCPAAVNTGIHNSDRNRPGSLGNTASVQADRQYVQEKGLDPEEAGRAVLRGVEENRFYIFTHPGIKKHNDKKQESLNAAFNWWQEQQQEKL